MLYTSTYYGVAGFGDDTLTHHGIKGQKWGVRRYQNPDGTLTAAGKQRYFNADGTLTKAGEKQRYRLRRKETSRIHKSIDDEWSRGDKELDRLKRDSIMQLKEKKKNREINAKQYRERKNSVIDTINSSHEDMESRAMLEHYKAIKQLRLDKATLEKNIHGINSRQYKKTEKLLKRNWESYGDYQIEQKPDGTWRIVKTEAYYY